MTLALDTRFSKSRNRSSAVTTVYKLLVHEDWLEEPLHTPRSRANLIKLGVYCPYLQPGVFAVLAQHHFKHSRFSFSSHQTVPFEKKTFEGGFTSVIS